ncbi:MAG: family 20 glycosylhydrolase [Bacteroidales bacterium]|nr:family 20 glycosylhydrolase [Bacteroidales bacterium]
MNGKFLPLILLCAAIGLSAERGATAQSSENQNYTNLSYGGLIPVPKEYEETDGTFELKEPVTVYLTASGADQSGADNLRAYLSQLCADQLAASETAVHPSVTAAHFNVKFVETPDEAQVRISIDGESGMAAEGYMMNVGAEGISIDAGTEAGAFYAVQDILQMTRWGESGEIPCCEISDEPRLPYRGLHVDVSRHFRSKEFLMKQMDAMALFRLNKMHLHLTDAAGWRIEIEGWPRLTELAAWRPQRVWADWTAAGEPYCTQDEPGAYGGYYTKDDIREILAYAAQRHIEVIPEIEMPGHSEEVLAAYPQLGCTGEDGEPASGSNGRHNSDLCPGKEATFDFLEDVLGQVIDLFPSQYIHIGGDEASKAAWKTCPDCRRRMQEECLSSVDELQSYLIQRVEAFVNSRGRQIIGWDEILQGGLAPNAVVMSWRGMQGGIDAARMGHDVIMTPTSHCYLDYYQDAPFKEPAAFGGYVPLAQTYSLEPVPAEMTDGKIEENSSLTDKKTDLNVGDETAEKLTEHIIGVQGNLWAEYVTEDSHAEYMYYPRALAIAETGWSPAEKKDYDDFRKRALTALETLHRMGFTTFDLANEYGERPESRTPAEHLALGCPVTYLTPYSSRYIARGDASLTDGLLGGWGNVGDRWQGFNGDMEVIVDLGEPRKVHSVEATFMNSEPVWIHIPKSMEVSVSNDGEHFSALGVATSDEDCMGHEVFYVPYIVNSAPEGEDAEGITARYIRMKANVNDRRGAWVFTDEIIVM